MLRLLLSSVLSVVVFSAVAQQAGNEAQTNLISLVKGAPAVLPKNGAEGLKGSPYADNRWLPARLEMSNNMPLAPVPLKYDVLNRRLLMRPVNRPNDSLQLDDRLLAGFTLEEPGPSGSTTRQRHFRRFREADLATQKAEYVEVVYQGKYSLLKRYVKVVRKANNQGAYNAGERFDEIMDKTIYLLHRPDGSLVPVKLTLKSMQGAAPALSGALGAVPTAGAATTEEEWASIFTIVDPK